MRDWLDAWWPYLTFAVAVVEVVAAGHAVLRKREPRAAVAWVVIIVLVPILGLLLYALFGINRISRAGARLRDEMPNYDHVRTARISGSQLQELLEEDTSTSSLG